MGENTDCGLLCVVTAFVTVFITLFPGEPVDRLQVAGPVVTKQSNITKTLY